MAEWLRRLTRNQIPSGSVGSNPTDRGFCSILSICFGELPSVAHIIVVSSVYLLPNLYFFPCKFSETWVKAEKYRYLPENRHISSEYYRT